MCNKERILQRQHFICTALVFVLATQLVIPVCSVPRTVWVVIKGALQPTSSQEAHYHMLTVVFSSEEVAQNSLIYSYNKSFDGFAALLTPQEAANISAMPGVASLFDTRNLGLHTTRSWTLLGLPAKRQSPRTLALEGKVIVGVLDTGIWPESESYGVVAEQTSDDQRAPGLCDFDVSCPPRVDTAKSYAGAAAAQYHPPSPAKHADFQSLDAVRDEYATARDFNGHGTHTSSTAAGSSIMGANLSGLAAGESQGAVPGTRIAVFKVCFGMGYCNDADILAAFDDAISQGVHVLSLSFGGSAINNLFADSIALGSFYAMQKGIVVVSSAGNDGPDLAGATNVAPWVITVGASSIDRQFFSEIVLGNNVTLTGRAINTEVPTGYQPLIDGADAGFRNVTGLYCRPGSLDALKVKGKLVVCESGVEDPHEQSATVSAAGGVGMILIDDSATEIGAFSLGVPTSVIGAEDGDTLRTYLHSSSSPMAQILPTSDPLHQPSPLLASFSSRGPNRVNYQVFKPDLTAPGVNILASWSPAHGITNEPQDHRFVNYNIVSGTSVACSHVAGAVAYVKSLHPSWSPAAIKSALMTTANPLDVGHASNEDGEFGFGVGQINPRSAINPGLVYDMSWEDYAEFLCAEGYNKTVMRLITGDQKVCMGNKGTSDLNYPAVSIAVDGGSSEAREKWWEFKRTVTNVGEAKTIYEARVELEVGMKVEVMPKTLVFTKLMEKQSFNIRVQAAGLKTSISPRIGTRLSSSLVWHDNSSLISVRSPIVAWISPPPHHPWPLITSLSSTFGFRI